MANVKFSDFAVRTTVPTVDYIVGYQGADNIQIAPTDFLGAYLPLAGGTMVGSTNHGNNIKSIYGTGGDFEIYHSGSTGYIADVGSGDLKVLFSNDFIIEAINGETCATFTENGAVDLYYDNVKTFETTATGVKIVSLGTGSAPPWDAAKGDGIIFNMYNDGSPYLRHASIVANSGDTSATQLEFYTTPASGSGSLALTLDSSQRIVVGSDKVIYAGGYGGGLVIRQNNATGDRLIKMVTVDSSGAIVNDDVLVVKAGYVGIGTDSPSSILHVAGTPGSVAGSGIFFSGNTAIWQPSASTLAIRPSGTDIATFTSTRVGIGTSVPGTTLHVDSVAAYPTLTLARSSTHPGLSFTAGLTKFTGAGTDLVVEGVGNDTGFGFRTVNSIGTLIDTLILIPSGNVGIGTTTPDEKLHILDTTGANIILNSNANAANSGVYMSEGADATPTQNGAYVYYDGTNNEFKIATGAAALADRLTIARDTGAIQFNEYGAGTFAGTATYDLSVDVNGNIIETTGGGAGGPFVPYMSGADQIARTECAATWNTSLGCQSLQALAAGGTYNTALGGKAGTALTTGDRNIAIGYSALAAEDTGSRSVAVGYQALSTQNYGTNNYNVAVGYAAGTNVVGGVQNTLIGSLAGDALTDGNYNVAVGMEALDATTIGTNNVAIGKDTLGTNILTDRNVAIGIDALKVMVGDGVTNNQTTYNTAVGYGAGQAVTSGINNNLLGGLAGAGLTAGASNVAIGYAALSTEDDHGRNIAIGELALASQNAGVDAYNVAIGYNAGTSMLTGTNNTLIGSLAGDALTTGVRNVAVGYGALQQVLGM